MKTITTSNLIKINFSDDFTGDGITTPLGVPEFYVSSTDFTGDGLTPATKLSLKNPSGGSSDPTILPYKEVTANYTVVASDYTINTTANSFTVTLPATGVVGKTFIIKNSVAGTTITVKSTVTIDGVLSKTLTNRTALKVQFTGTKYIII